MWLFRVAMAAEFVGHGVFGWHCKPAWIPYFGVAGLDPDIACRLMPWVGTHDVLLGLIGLFSPRPVVLAWMTFWGFWTATLRPLAGEPIWEMVERAGNIGLPLAFLLFTWPVAGGLKAWFAPARPPQDAADRLPRLATVLRWTTALLLIGHGALSSICCKELLAQHYALLGWRPMAFGAGGALLEPARFLGALEIGLGALILARPLPALLILALAWKLFTESLYPLNGAPIWEFVERGGSYAAPLGLLITYRYWKMRQREPSPAGE